MSSLNKQGKSKAKGIIILVIVILGILFLATNQEFTLFSASVTSSCRDEDNGIDIFTKSEISGGLNKYGEIIKNSQEDYCYDDTSVVEYYCENGQRKAKKINCPEGEKCVSGQCTGGFGDGNVPPQFALTRTCQDPDGDNPNNAGYTYSETGQKYTDYCTTTGLIEWICKDGSLDKVVYDCNCVNNVCEGESTTTTPSTPSEPSEPVTSSECSINSDCCTSPRCDEGRLLSYQEPISLSCVDGDVVATTYRDWSCWSATGCEYNYKSGRVIEYCDNGCEETSSTEAECISQICTPNEIIDTYCVDGNSLQINKCNSDGSGETGTSVWCENGCSNGECVGEPTQTCEDECTLGDAWCATSEYRIICKDWDGDGCTEWAQPSQFYLCDYGCENTQCKSAPPVTQCEEGNFGVEYCSGDKTKIYQDYRYVSNNECLTGTKTVGTCPNGEECWTGDMSSRPVCVALNCDNLKPTDQCSGDKTKILTYRQEAYPDCKVYESVKEDCASKDMVCDSTSNSCVPKQVEVETCELDWGTENLALSQTQGLSTMSLFSINSISSGSAAVKTDEAVFVKYTQRLTKSCKAPKILHSIGNGAYSVMIDLPTENVNLDECVEQEASVDFATRISFENAGTHTIHTSIICDENDAGDETEVAKESIWDILKDTILWYNRDVAPVNEQNYVQISDTVDTFTIVVEERAEPLPPSEPVVEDRCDECGTFCSESECLGLGACQYIPGGFFSFLGLGNTCTFVENIAKVPCNTAADCPSTRCEQDLIIGDIRYSGVEALMENPICNDGYCAWEDVTNCGETDKYCSVNTGRCEQPLVDGFCDGNLICDQPIWGSSSNEYICDSELRECDTCVQTGERDNRAGPLSATGYGCDEPDLCPNGYINPGEDCDGNLFREDMNTCQEIDSDYIGGSLSCHSNCQIDDSNCYECRRNNDCDDKEICDDGECKDVDCVDDNDCNSDKECVSNLCVLKVECEDNSDCESDEKCEEGNCVDKSDENCDGTLDGECSSDVPLYCDNGELTPSQQCCPSGTILNNEGVCEEDDVICDPNLDDITCTITGESGQELECLSSTSRWTPTGTTCDAELCSPTLGCIDTTCETDEDCPIPTCVGGNSTCESGVCQSTCGETCELTPCIAECDPDLTQICVSDGSSYFSSTVCEATRDGYTTVKNYRCEDICEEGEILLFNECQNQVVVIGGAIVIIGLVIFAFSSTGTGKGKVKVFR